MIDLPHQLRRFPYVFDRLNRINRRWRHRSPIYTQLLRHLPERVPFTFLQIGANDGISIDPYREFLIRREARGVCIEPVPDYFEKLVRNYRSYTAVIPDNSAVGYPSGHQSFYAYMPKYLAGHGNSAELAGLASFTREKLAVRLSPTDRPDECIQEITIPVRTVEEIMDRHGFESFDCLFLDCEGHEENILLNLNFDGVRPRLIAFEHTHFSDQGRKIETHLAAKGFHFTRLTHDTIASR